MITKNNYVPIKNVEKHMCIVIKIEEINSNEKKWPTRMNQKIDNELKNVI